MENAQKRNNRAQNFSENEKLAIISLIDKKKHIIENRQQDSVTKQEKNAAWSEIVDEFQKEKSVQRTVISVQRWWEKMKMATKKKFAEVQRELKKTGGGVTAIGPSVAETACHKIIQKTMKPVPNCLDSNAANPPPQNYISNLKKPSKTENDENNKPVRDYLIHIGEIDDWSKVSKQKLKKPLSQPLQNAIQGESHQKNQTVTSTSKEKQKDLLNHKLDLINTMKRSILDHNNRESELHEITLKKAKLELELIEKKNQALSKTDKF